MNVFRKMFGRKDPVEEMCQLHARQDWAGVLNIAAHLDRSGLDDPTLQEVIGWENQAGDALAALNLEEGAWAQQSGNLLRAREDYQLAAEQARAPALRERAKQALAALERGEQPGFAAGTDDRVETPSGCSSCTPAASVARQALDTDLDEEARLELLLAAMPGELAERYDSAGPAFRKAWLAIQDGDEERAYALLEEVPEEERTGLYLFERGSLAARSGRHNEALVDLQAALSADPDLLPAFDAMIDVLFAAGMTDVLEKTLKGSLAAGRFAGYCWARLAELHARRQEAEPALAAGLKALDEGFQDQGLILLCAQLLERVERYDDAEALLRRLPAGGCGGGIHPLLAEFWLRREQKLDQSLESFKGALRQESDNPRWLLRIAQVYAAKGWRKEATEQVARLLRHQGLTEVMRSEANALMDRLQQT